LDLPVEVWRFEDLRGGFSSELAVSRSNGKGVFDFGDADESPDEADIPFSDELKNAMQSVLEEAFTYYYISESDEGEYRLTPEKKGLIDDEYWVQPGFVQAVYQVSQAILRTADGWVW